MSKALFLIRGLPGSGKTTLAESLDIDAIVAADDYFYDEGGNYNFDAAKLPDAHGFCKNRVCVCMENEVEKIAVTNTFTKEGEMEPYILLAETYEYTVFTIIVENRHGNKSIHNVPSETIDKMRNRFQIKL